MNIFAPLIRRPVGTSLLALGQEVAPLAITAADRATTTFIDSLSPPLLS